MYLFDQVTFAKPQRTAFLVNQTSIKLCQGFGPDDCATQRQACLMTPSLLAHDNNISAVEIPYINAEGLVAFLDRR